MLRVGRQRRRGLRLRALKQFRQRLFPAERDEQAVRQQKQRAHAGERSALRLHAQHDLRQRLLRHAGLAPLRRRDLQRLPRERRVADDAHLLPLPDHAGHPTLRKPLQLALRALAAVKDAKLQRVDLP